jgi:hypothetical protein
MVSYYTTRSPSFWYLRGTVIFGDIFQGQKKFTLWGRKYSNLLLKQTTQNAISSTQDKHNQTVTLGSLVGGYQHFRGSHILWA